MTKVKLLLTSAAASVVASAASAQQDVGEIADTFVGQGDSLASLAVVASVVGGLFVLFMAMLKFRSASANPNDPNASVGGAVALFFVGIGLVALPMFTDTGVATIFGSETDTRGDVAGGLDNFDIGTGG